MGENAQMGEGLHEIDDESPEGLYAFLAEREWGDGLPVVAPPQDRVGALLGGLDPLWTIPSSFFFGGLLFGANAMQRAVQVPAALIVALNGLVVVFVVSSDRLRRAVGESLGRERKLSAGEDVEARS